MKMTSFEPKIIEQLKRLGVAIVYLYGSQAIGRASRLSDVDVGIVLRNPEVLRDQKHRFELRFELMECLESALCPETSREIDLVFLQTASPVLGFEVINAMHPLFVADPLFQVDYEESVMRNYLDSRPLLETHFQAVLDRVA